MSALQDALLHSTNRPGQLVPWLAAQVNPGAELSGLQDGGGVFCDFRPGLEEQNASLSADMKPGGAVFHRFGGDGFQGGAVDFVMSCLAVDKGEAARLLIERAGLVDTPPAKGKAQAGAAKALAKLGSMGPLSEQQQRDTLKGWAKLTGDGLGQEEEEMARRGLTPALLSGLLTAYRFTGRQFADPAHPTAKPGKVYRLPGQFLPSVVLTEQRGPDGQPWAYKGRNPGSKEKLAALEKNRYAYPKGSKAAAWCSPGLTDAAAEVWTEGELNGVAVALMLEAAGSGGVVGVQGIAGSEGLPHLTAGKRVYVYADPDEAGDKARQKWAGLAHHVGAEVYQLPADLFGGGDACELLPSGEAADFGARLLKAMQDAPLWTPPQVESEADGAAVVWTGKKTGYKVDGGRLCAFTLKEGDGEEYEAVEVLCEFAAHITAQVTLEDGTNEAARVFELEGFRPDGRPMQPPRVTVNASDFAGMNWPVAKWGAGAIVRAGQGKKDKAREAIQQLSAAAGMIERTVYQHTGWITHEQHGPLYLTAGAVIGAAGGVDGVDVELTGRLTAYALPDPAKEEASAIRAAVRASLELLDLTPDGVSVPVMGAIYRAPLGRLNTVIWLTGETGRNKTAYLALAQSHYGAGWNAEYLPDAWNSTANALEKSAFSVKDAPFLIDDFKPSGNLSDTNKAHGNVSRILQGVADGQGRATLSADRKSRAGLYPRGTVMSSAEALPRGHSNRARAVLVDVRRKLIDSRAKSEAFYQAADLAASGVYALALAAYVQTLAGHLEGVKVGSTAHRERTRQLAPRFTGAHGRTGPAAAELAYGWEVFLSFAVQVGAVGEGEAAHLWGRVLAALEDTADSQGEHLHEEDPVHRALSLLSGLLAQGRAYLEDLDEGGVPAEPEAAGWQRHTFELHGGGEGEDFKPRPGASLLGYVSKQGGDVWAYFLPDALHEALQSVASKQGGAALPDPAGLWANMRDRFYPSGLMRCDVEKAAGRVRPYVKVTAKGKRERLLCLRFPLDLDRYFVGTLGTVGTDSPSTLTDTALSAVPTFNSFSSLMGTLGTVRPSSSPASSFAGAELGESGEEEAWAVTV